MRPTTWLRPYLTVWGFLLTSSFFLPSLTAVASLRRRSFFSGLVSGRYLLRSLKAWAAVFLSRTCWNCASRGNLQAHLEDLLLALEADILGPLHHAGDIALGLDVLADTKVAGTLLDQGVLGTLLVTSLALGERGGGDLLARFGGHLVGWGYAQASPC